MLTEAKIDNINKIVYYKSMDIKRFLPVRDRSSKIPHSIQDIIGNGIDDARREGARHPDSFSIIHKEVELELPGEAGADQAFDPSNPPE